MRKAGVLCAVSSLPSNYGIGDFGPETVLFLKEIKKAGFKLWQILPLNPLGFGNSPYQPFSSFAMDEIYISLDELVKMKLIQQPKPFEALATTVDYDAVRAYKEPILREAFSHFKKNTAYNQFLQEEWLSDYVLFQTLHKMNQGKPWQEWEKKERSEYTAELDQEMVEEMEYQRFLQFILSIQWGNIRKVAKKLGIEILGDIPFYVGLDSADVWGNQENFLLDEEAYPTCVAGVPPDYFSETGQRWGNPIYDWEFMEKDDFRFWLTRLGYAYNNLDCIRIDHFRAFDTYWKIPATCLTAMEGEWVEAPGYVFFDRLFELIPEISIVAEDLGMLRQEVLTLRDHYHFKGMKILEFSYDKENAIDTMEEKKNQIIYTGTHDNDTLVGWLSTFSANEKRKARTFFKSVGCEAKTLAMSFVHYCLKSESEWAIIALQDLLELDSRARMNAPGTIGGDNWKWKVKNLKGLEKISPEIKKIIKEAKR